MSRWTESGGGAAAGSRAAMILVFLAAAALYPAAAERSATAAEGITTGEEEAATAADEPGRRVLTLERSIAIALEQNLGIQQQRKSHQMSEQGLRFTTAERFYPRAWAQFLLPSYGQRTVVNFDPITQTEEFIPSESGRWDGDFSLSFPIFTGGEFLVEYNAFRLNQLTGDEEDVDTYSNTARLSFVQPILGDNVNRIAQTKARYSMEIAEEALRREIVTLTYNTTGAYYGLAKAAERVKLGRARLAQSESSHEIAVKKYHAGLIPEVEALQLEVERERSRADLETALASRDRAEDQLKDVLGLDLGERLDVVADVPVPEAAIDVEEAVHQALATRSDIREMVLRIKMGRLDLRSIRRENNISGDLSLYYERDGQGDTFDDSIDNLRDNKGLTVMVGLPVFDSGRNKAQVTRQRLELESQELALADLRRQVELDVRDAARDVEAARSRLEILSATLEVAERTYRINYQRFEVGTLTSQDLFLEEVRLNETRQDHLNALIDFHLAWARFLQVVNM